MQNWIQSLGLIPFLFIGIAISLTMAEVKEIIEISSLVGIEIDRTENKKYNLFPEHRGFLRAEFLKIGNQYRLEITNEVSGKRMREERNISVEQFEIYRQKIVAVDEKIAESTEEKWSLTKKQQQGRYWTVAASTAIGSSLYTFGAIRLLGAKGKSAIALGMVIPATSFVGSLAMTRTYDLGYGRSRLLRWGAYGGIMYGYTLPKFFESGNEKTYLVSAMVAAPIGAYTIYKLSQHHWIEKGESNMLINGGMAGGLYGLALPYILMGKLWNDTEMRLEVCDGQWDLETDRGRLVECPYEVSETNWNRARVYASSWMVGVPLGVWFTSRYMENRNISQGQALMISLGGATGALYGAGIFHAIVGEEYEQGHLLLASVGLATGAYFSDRVTDGNNYSVGRGRLVTLGGGVGALVGSMLLQLIEPEDSDIGSRAFVTSIIGGSAAGFWIANRLTQNWGEEFSFNIGSKVYSPKVSITSPWELIYYAVIERDRKSVSRNVPLSILRVAF
ncbi:MAG: hypothetical protein VCF25_07815 [Candidatus Poribacteria bacterium]